MAFPHRLERLQYNQTQTANNQSVAVGSTLLVAVVVVAADILADIAGVAALEDPHIALAPRTLAAALEEPRDRPLELPPVQGHCGIPIAAAVEERIGFHLERHHTEDTLAVAVAVEAEHWRKGSAHALERHSNCQRLVNPLPRRLVLLHRQTANADFVLRYFHHTIDFHDNVYRFPRSAEMNYHHRRRHHHHHHRL